LVVVLVVEVPTAADENRRIWGMGMGMRTGTGKGKGKGVEVKGRSFELRCAT
jgi:hypothetical protein